MNLCEVRGFYPTSRIVAVLSSLQDADSVDCNAMRIGVGNGQIKNCVVSNLVIKDSAKGVCLESRYAFNDDIKIGTKIENISFNNIYMETKLPLFISSHCDGIVNKPMVELGAVRFGKLGNAEVRLCNTKKTYKALKRAWKNAEYDLCTPNREIPEKYYK